LGRSVGKLKVTVSELSALQGPHIQTLTDIGGEGIGRRFRKRTDRFLLQRHAQLHLTIEHCTESIGLGSQHFDWGYLSEQGSAITCPRVLSKYTALEVKKQIISERKETEPKTLHESSTCPEPDLAVSLAPDLSTRQFRRPE
jgi:hypothetical protein